MPRDLPVEAHEYLLVPTRAASAGEALDDEPRPVWRTSAGHGVASLPAVSSRVTIVTSTDRWIYALDTRNGETFWRRRGDGAHTVGAAVGGGRVFVASEGTAGRVTALRLTDGKRIWQTLIGDVPSPLVLRDSVVYAVNEQGVAFALSAARGHVIWRRYAGPSRSGALVTARHVVVATLRDSLFVIDRAGGTVVGAFRLPAPTTAPLALLDDTTAALTSPQGSVHAISIATGRAIWSVQAGEPVPGSPVVHADTIFALGGSCTLIRVPHHVPLAMRRDSVSNCVTVAAPLVLRNGVLVATVAGEITYVSRTTGMVMWSRSIGGALRHPPVVRDRQVVLATLGGDILGFR